MKTVLSRIQTDTTKQPIFCGQDLSLQRYDKFKYPIFFELFKDQLEFFWRPEEVSLRKDRSDFINLTETEKFIFLSNLQYQTLMDSVIGRGINVMNNHVSIPEVEACFNVWQTFETIHSYSYTYIIKNVFSNPEEVFDNILCNKEIMKRADSITKHYDNLIGDCQDENDLLLTSLVATNILEGIRFYISFACGFFFAEMSKMEGNAKILKLISRDEAKHVAITQNLLRILRENEEEGFSKLYKQNEKKIISMFRDAVEEEKEWANYLFSNGSLLGLNAKILHGYIEWLCNARLKSLGHDKIYDVKSNPIGGWLSNWTDSSKVQNAPQETEIESYKIKAYKLPEDEEFGDLTL